LRRSEDVSDVYMDASMAMTSGGKLCWCKSSNSCSLFTESKAFLMSIKQQCSGLARFCLSWIICSRASACCTHDLNGRNPAC
jgi:hypothetical protein